MGWGEGCSAVVEWVPVVASGGWSCVWPVGLGGCGPEEAEEEGECSDHWRSLEECFEAED